jgi:hypothetical protein
VLKLSENKRDQTNDQQINYSIEHAHTSLMITLAQVYNGERLLLFNLAFSKDSSRDMVAIKY